MSLNPRIRYLAVFAAVCVFYGLPTFVSVAAGAENPVFGPDSNVFTNPYYSDYTVGFEKVLAIPGNAEDEYIARRVLRSEVFSDVRCNVEYLTKAEGGQVTRYEFYWIAQDNLSNIRLMRIFGWSKERGDYSADLSANPPVVVPADFSVGTSFFAGSNATEVVVETGVTVPQNVFEQGPFENCAVTKRTVNNPDGTQEISFQYWAPQTATVRIRWDDDPDGGYHIAQTRIVPPLPPVSERFGPDSAVITNKYLNEYRPGFEKTMTGYGIEEGKKRLFRVEKRESFKEIDCVVLYYEQVGTNEFQRHFLAQDKQGYVWSIAIAGRNSEQGDFFVDRTDSPSLVAPAGGRPGWLLMRGITGRIDVLFDMGVPLVRNRFGLGPFDDCAVERQYEVDTQFVNYEYMAPGIGLVKEEWFGDASSGYAISDLKLAPGQVDTPTPPPQKPTPTPEPQKPTPTWTATPGPFPEPWLPWRVFTMDSADEFTRYPGGFDGNPPGSVAVGAIPPGGPMMTDGNGVSIITAPGQLELLLFPTLDVGDKLVFMRASVQSVGKKAAIALAVLDGSMDGSIATNIPANSAIFEGGYDRMVLLYDPPGTTIIPVIQVANLTGEENVLVYLDNLEIYLLPKEGSVPNALLHGD